jgi:predicted nucleic acid-binding protein
MITAIDTSVLIAIAKDENGADRWVDLLAAGAAEGELVICDVVAAELFAVLMDHGKFERLLKGLRISFSPMQLASAELAGRVFKGYRREGGPREHLIPDFLIGAHAAVQARRIAAIDRGYLRRYFPRLKVVSS